jgi:hypothetical protein
MKPSKSTKRQRFSNKKTRRIKRIGGMYKGLYPHLTPKQRAEAYAKMREKERAKESAAAHAVLMDRLGISHSDRLATLTSAAALPDMVAAQLVAPNPQMSLHRHAPNVTGREPIPAMFEAADMFRQAEQLCSRVKGLTDAEMWTRPEWGSITCTPAAKRMCEDAVHLYEGAIERKYLPAYAPLAWMLSYSDPEESLRLCDECIAVCGARSGMIGVRFARKARKDCIAIRAFVQYQLAVDDLQEELEMMAPGGHMVPEMDASFMKQMHEIAMESMAKPKCSKYGYALQWLLLSTDFDEKTRNETEIDQAQKTAEKMGLDFERCRFCFNSHDYSKRV